MKRILIVGITFLLTLFIAGTVYSNEKPKKKLYLKSGTVIECDIFWEGIGDFIWYKKSLGRIGHWKDEVDLVKTFGEVDGKEIAVRYAETIKQRELRSKPIIITAEQERWMRKKERVQVQNQGEQVLRIGDTVYDRVGNSNKYKLDPYAGLTGEELREAKRIMKELEERARREKSRFNRSRMGKRWYIDDSGSYRRKIPGS